MTYIIIICSAVLIKFPNYLHSQINTLSQKCTHTEYNTHRVSFLWQRLLFGRNHVPSYKYNNTIYYKQHKNTFRWWLISTETLISEAQCFCCCFLLRTWFLLQCLLFNNNAIQIASHKIHKTHKELDTETLHSIKANLNETKKRVINRGRKCAKMPFMFQQLLKSLVVIPLRSLYDPLSNLLQQLNFV